MIDFLQAIHQYFIDPILFLIILLVFIWVIVGWLVAFNVINIHSPQARQLVGSLNAIVDPMLRPIRQIVPPIGNGLDLSPLIFILIVMFVKNWLLIRVFYVWLPGIA